MEPIKLTIEAEAADISLSGIAAPTGKSILKAELTANGELVFIYTDGTQANIGNVVGRPGDPGTKLLHTKLFEPSVVFEVGEETAYVDIDMVCEGFAVEDFIFDSCGYVFKLSEIRPDEYYTYVFQCLGKWLGEDGEDGEDGVSFHYVDGTPTIGEYGDISYQWTDSNAPCKVGDFLLFGGDGTLYVVRAYHDGNANLKKVTIIAANGLKLSDFENDAGFLAYDSTERVFDANEYFDFKISTATDVTENLPSYIASESRWGLIFTLLQSVTQKTGVQYFFDSYYRIHTRNIYAGTWSVWSCIGDPNTVQIHRTMSSNYNTTDSTGTYICSFSAKSTLSFAKEMFLFIPTVSNISGMNYISLGSVGTYPICYRNADGKYTTQLPEGFLQSYRAVLLVYSGGYFEVLNYWG